VLSCCHGLYLQVDQERKDPDPGPRNAIAAALIKMGDRVALYVGMAVVSLEHAARILTKMHVCVTVRWLV
jgi:hypothetical protein